MGKSSMNGGVQSFSMHCLLEGIPFIFQVDPYSLSPGGPPSQVCAPHAGKNTVKPT